MNVLIVDDSQLVVDRLEGMLTEASDPDGSGIDVLKEAKRKLPAPVVIMLTNYQVPEVLLGLIRDRRDSRGGNGGSGLPVV